MTYIYDCLFIKNNMHYYTNSIYIRNTNYVRSVGNLFRKKENFEKPDTNSGKISIFLDFNGNVREFIL